MTKKVLPFILQPIKAGFPNPAEDASQEVLDLNDLIIRHPASTFYMRVDGDSMQDANIYTGDIVVVDKSLEARSGDLVVACIDGEFTLKHFVRHGERVQLMPANKHYAPIEVDESSDFRIWGVVTYTIHAHRK